VLERWVSEQGKVLAELKADMAIMKESLLDMKEINEKSRKVRNCLK